MVDGNVYFRQFLDGDTASFEKLIKMYRESLIFFCMRYTHNSSLAEEIAEDSFVELLLHKDRFNFSCSVKTYLFTIARNKAVNMLRKSKFSTELENFENSLEDTASLEEAVIKSDESRLLYKVLDKLSDDYRCALYLVYIEDLSYAQAGKVMKKSIKQIENLVYRAKAAARKELEKEGIVREV